ncbi:MAG TPA: M17 family peptidase N-terminal domain-containing protein [Acidimicrobiales bacterium]|nr:M17 family peptidase N-terminal domain-containing protein [Acidimicrobiales bacterium]
MAVVTSPRKADAGWVTGASPLATVDVVEQPTAATVVGLPTGTADSGGDVPAELGVSRDGLTAAGFRGRVGDTLVVPGADGSARVAVGIGDPAELDAAGLRDAAAAFARAAVHHAHVALLVPPATELAPADAAQAVVEGVLLARYRYGMKHVVAGQVLATLEVVVPAGGGAGAGDLDAARAGARRGEAFASAAALARDLANAPPGLLTATRMAEVATAVAADADRRLDVEVFDRAQLEEMGCGGLLGVNAGSVEEPRMVKLTYRPSQPGGPHLTLVGKGVMYDSGGLSLKPADGVHATMKNDMSGAGAILAALSVLAELDCTATVRGYLMCTDNMPSGSALRLGDIITIRGGTTVEVINTDAEGRLVMADALVLATEPTDEPTDAIVDIATLTGACLRALGPEVAGVFGNDQTLVDQVEAAAEATDEPVWQLPLDHRYRRYLDTPIADIKNLGGEHAGAITAALFLADFVGTTPWAHIDIAGPAQNDADRSWRPAGCTGFGARLLLELALGFTAPTPTPTA